jgi:2-keto-myo-inositol isomerase
MTLRFAVNRMSAPRLPFADFAAMAQRLGVDAIEIRNDLASVEMEDGTPGRVVGAIARDHGLSIRSINALQRFEQFDGTRAAEARALMAYAAECGAQALVLCPTNSLRDARSAQQRHDDLLAALSQLAPMLRDHGLGGLVEPLGFGECAVRSKSQAVRAIRELPDASPFALVHDTFHHHLAGEDLVFPELTGLVHVSGVEDAGLDVAHMRDGHRVLVGAADRLGNVEQLARLLSAGYSGYASFEPFADEIATAGDIEERLAQSMRHLERAVGTAIAGA